MATLRDIQRRIGSVKNTQKITKAMKMVAAAKLRRAQDKIMQARPYAKKMEEMLHHLATQTDTTQFPLLAPREIKTVGIIVVSADRGLCGGFNANVARAAVQHINKNYSELNAQGKVKLICVGKKSYEYFSKRNYDVLYRHVGIYADLQFQNAKNIVGEIMQGFLAGEIDKVEVIYNQFKTQSQQQVKLENFLPVVTDNSQSLHGETDYIYEPTSSEIISALVPKHLDFQIWKILLDSNAAEQGARMVAMENATTNAKEMIRSLQLSYNKARQASITKELIEIISGANALKKAS